MGTCCSRLDRSSCRPPETGRSSCGSRCSLPPCSSCTGACSIRPLSRIAAHSVAIWGGWSVPRATRSHRPEPFARVVASHCRSVPGGQTDRLGMSQLPRNTTAPHTSRRNETPAHSRERAGACSWLKHPHSSRHPGKGKRLRLPGPMLSPPCQNPVPVTTEMALNLDGRTQVVHSGTPIEGSTTGDGR